MARWARSGQSVAARFTQVVPTNGGSLLAVGQTYNINHTWYDSAFVGVFSATEGATELIRAYANGTIMSASVASNGDLFVSGNYVTPYPDNLPPTMMDLGGGTLPSIRRTGCLCRRSAPPRRPLVNDASTL